MTHRLFTASAALFLLFHPQPAAAQSAPPANALVRLLASGQAVFGIFSGEKTAEQGARMAGNRETDFVFYSMESGPFDIPRMRDYMRALWGGEFSRDKHPFALRIPAIREDPPAAEQRVQEALAAGVHAIVFPHVETAEQAALAVRFLQQARPRLLWPVRPDGELLCILIIEDRVGVENARQIARTPGIGVLFAGPGDLRRAYNGDAPAIENAIQQVLSACREFGVPCGITAGQQDIASRLEQGFRAIIVTQPEALAVGRKASGREP